MAKNTKGLSTWGGVSREHALQLEDARERIADAKRIGSEVLDIAHLAIKSDELEMLMPDIKAIRNLRDLSLQYNRLEVLPIALCEFTRLEALFLSNNQLAALPPQIGAMRSLTCLGLGHNQLFSIPSDIGALSHLMQLWLNDNRLASIPPDIGRLRSLVELRLDNNLLPLSGLPRDLLGLPGLTHLMLHGNSSLPIPPEVLGAPWDECKPHSGFRRPASPRELLSYCFDLKAAAEQGRTRPLNEAKLVVVGPEAVGKTSLVRYLIERRSRDPNERRTPGLATREKIDIKSFATATPETPDAPRLNVWDFGGQEVMYETHQYFLRERCLYLLVLEARREDDQSVHYWMKTIRNRAGDAAPVIVVINKFEPPSQIDKIDDTALRHTYPNIRAIVRTSCNPGSDRAIEGLRVIIRDLVKNDPQLKHVHDPFQRAYLDVKERLGDSARRIDIVEVSEYERICRDVGIVDEQEQHRLLDLLDAIGVVVAHHGQGAPESFRHAALLNPNWVTQAIYDLLLDEAIAKNNAELDLESLGSHLREPAKYPRKHWQLIIEMMEHFGLCLPLRTAKKKMYLIPAQLSKDEPEDLKRLFPEEGSLRFQFHYDLLPPWLVPRLIVEAREHLEEPRVAWRNGVVVRAEACVVLVRAETSEKRVRLFVRGPSTRRRSGLSLVRGFMKTVHSINPGIDPEECIPLPDNPGAPPVPYVYVCELEQEEGPDYSWRPPGAKRKYSVRELLDCVESAEQRRVKDETILEKLTELLDRRTRAIDPIVSLKWEALTPESFERLIYNILSGTDGYENASWLTRTNAPDSGRDIAVERAKKDRIGVSLRERLIVQCKHWLTSSIGPDELAKLLLQMETWQPPPVDVLVIATSGHFTTDAVRVIEMKNLNRHSPRIEMWNRPHLERILSQQPQLIDKFELL